MIARPYLKPIKVSKKEIINAFKRHKESAPYTYFALVEEERPWLRLIGFLLDSFRRSSILRHGLTKPELREVRLRGVLAMTDTLFGRHI